MYVSALRASLGNGTEYSRQRSIPLEKSGNEKGCSCFAVSLGNAEFPKFQTLETSSQDLEQLHRLDVYKTISKVCCIKEHEKNILDELTQLEQSKKNRKEFKTSLYNMNLSANYTELIERMKIAFKEFLN